MFKKIITAMLMISLLTTISGCSGEFRKKFVRNKKSKKKQTPVFKPKSYEAEFTRGQRYVNHYAFWKNAQAELIKMLGDKEDINNKKFQFHASYAINELKEMQILLPNEEKKLIQPYVDNLSALVNKMKYPHYVKSHRYALAKKMKHIFMDVTKKFSYKKMKNLLK